VNKGPWLLLRAYIHNGELLEGISLTLVDLSVRFFSMEGLVPVSWPIGGSG